MQSSLIVMAGLPGTGKSTLVKHFVDGYQYISSDQYIEDKAKELSSTYNELFASEIGNATKHVNQEIDIAIKNGLNVLIDQTNLGEKKRKGLIQRFNKYYKHCICILAPTVPDYPEWSKRINSRVGKIIPPHIITQMMGGYQIPTLDEGWDEISYFDMYGNFVKGIKNEKR